MTDAVVVAQLNAQDFPAGTVAGPIVFALVDSATGSTVATQSVTAGDTDPTATVTFPSVAPGTYTVTALRQDGNGATIAAAVVSAPFVVSAPNASITVPVSVAATLQ